VQAVYEISCSQGWMDEQTDNPKS